MKRNHMVSATVAALALVVSGCAQKSDIDAVQATQQEILTKLAKLEKGQQDILKQPAAAPARPARPQADPDKVYEVPIGDSYVLGPKDAPVTLTMFSDFQCPFCARAKPLIDEVMKEYPNDVNFVMKQFPLTQIHPQAEPAARAALAAGKQGKFWEMHDELYALGRNLNAESMKATAEKLGLDVAKWEADMESEELKKQVQEELQLGQRANVRGTPTFFINGKLAQGRSLNEWKPQIEEQIKEKKG